MVTQPLSDELHQYVSETKSEVMKNLSLLLVLLCISFVSCNKESNTPVPLVIEGITFENYPKLDGSTSVNPLLTIIACKLLNVPYSWQPNLENTYYIQPDYEKAFAVSPNFYDIAGYMTTGTHSSYLNLIDGKADLILVARTASEDEKTHANELGVNLIETPIALDAFVFITNKNNSVKNLTIKQIQDIYMGNITNWKALGGKDAKINPYIRNDNSGSHELMKELVMEDLEMPDWSEFGIGGMRPVFYILDNDVDGICYAVYYYKEQMVRDEMVRSFSINGVYPDSKSLRNNKYPLTTYVFAVIRSDLDKNNMAYKLYELLQTEAGKSTIEESGYIPN